MVGSSEDQNLAEYRCPTCQKLLFKGLLLICVVQIKCKKCGHVALYSAVSEPQDENTSTLLIDQTGIIVNASHGKSSQLLDGKRTVGTSIDSLFVDLGYPLCQRALTTAFQNSDLEHVYKDQVNDKGSTLALSWRLIPYHDTRYLYLALTRQPQKTHTKLQAHSPASV